MKGHDYLDKWNICGIDWVLG